MVEKGIGFELCSLNNLIRRYMDNRTNKKYIESLTGTNGWIIGYLATNTHKDIYQKDLEEEFSITRSTASKVLRLMEQKGLIERIRVPHDARLKKLVLTKKAWEISEIIKKETLEMEETLTKGFTEEELKNLTYYIKKMKNNMSRY